MAESDETSEELCGQLQPDLVLLHDHRPRLVGADLCRRMKRDPVNKLTPIGLIAYSQTSEEALRAREAGAADYWETPCSLRDALGRIDFFFQAEDGIRD